jgi:ribose/xylose/arabinose/galactoside ABC-type transport system permease subunit
MKKGAGDVFQKYGTAVILVILFVFFSIKSETFLSVSNIWNMLRQTSVTGIISVGMTMVMLTGGIDLSVSAIVAVSSVTCSICMVSLKMNMWLAILAAILIGLLAGLINGLFITYVKIPPLIATLGTQTAIRGIAYIMTNGYTVYGFPTAFDFIGKGYIAGIPVPVIVLVAALVVGWYVLNKTKFGRYLYAIGGNSEASRLSGININKRLVMTYVISGGLAAMAGIIELSRLSSGQPNAGEGYEMSAITAVVLGGISVSGGEGKFSGVIFGILIMGILSSGLVMMNVSTYYQQLIRGLVLLFAVSIDQILKRNLLAKSKRVRS